MEYYRAGGISVDQDFARFGSKSYAINKINTVDVRERRPHGSFMFTACTIIAVVTLLPMFVKFQQSFLLIFLIAASLAIWGWMRSRVIVYDLFLKTSSSDVQAYESRDEDMIMNLRVAVEKAMTAR